MQIRLTQFNQLFESNLLWILGVERLLIFLSRLLCDESQVEVDKSLMMSLMNKYVWSCDKHFMHSYDIWHSTAHMTIAPVTAYFISSLVFGSLYFSQIPARSKSDTDK